MSEPIETFTKLQIDQLSGVLNIMGSDPADRHEIAQVLVVLQTAMDWYKHRQREMFRAEAA